MFWSGPSGARARAQTDTHRKRTESILSHQRCSTRYYHEMANTAFCSCVSVVFQIDMQKPRGEIREAFGQIVHKKKKQKRRIQDKEEMSKVETISPSFFHEPQNATTLGRTTRNALTTVSNSKQNQTPARGLVASVTAAQSIETGLREDLFAVGWSGYTGPEVE